MPGRKSTLAGTAIVVADDHVDSADLLAMVLESAGADVRTGNTAGATLDVLADFTPAVLLLDITLPDMDGYELLTAIRALPGFDGTPAIAVTGHASERDKARSAEAGFAVHVTKPFDNDALVQVIGKLLAARATPTPSSTPLEATALQALRHVLSDKGIQIAPSETLVLELVAPLFTSG